MERLTFEKSRAKNIGLALMAGALVAASWFMVRKGDDSFDRLIGWFGVVFFGLGIVIGMKHALEGGVAFVLDHAGLIAEKQRLDHSCRAESWSNCHCSMHASSVVIRCRSDSCLACRRPREARQFNESMAWGHWGAVVLRRPPGNRRSAAVHPGKTRRRCEFTGPNS